MSESEFSIQSQLQLQQQLDAICGEFENHWSADRESDIPKMLSRVETEHRDQLLRILLKVEVALRRKAGQPISPEDYQQLGVSASQFVANLAAEDIDSTLPPNQSFSPPLDDATLTRSETSTSKPKRRIGPYKLLQQIGEGGMGSVWMAQQEEPVRRRVALKLIRADRGSKEIVARFEAERQALAMMNHQNIAKVLDAGTTDDGSPFFVMELVKGIPITKFCDEHKLSIRERLELFVPVCKAIQHAHQKGIVHRDLKPSNVLVTLYDGEAVPKVIDFGLAKALEHTTQLTDKTMFTEFGKVIGTLQYMSPEQAEMNALDVDTRTDIYSLGVMLYELLTGSTPLDKETMGKLALLKVLEIIKEREPPRPSHRLSSSGDAATGISAQRKIAPSKLRQILRGELDWVVMKALEKDRRRRYETASDFAQDIRRFLENEAVAARPPSFAYLARKVFFKNKFAIVTGLVVLGGLISALLLYANQKSKLATQQQKFAAEQRRLRNVAESTVERLAAKRYADKIALAQTQWRSGQTELARTTLSECDWSFRNWEHNYLFSKFNPASRKLKHPRTDAWGKETFHPGTADVSPDGQYVVGGRFKFRSNRQGNVVTECPVIVWNVATGQISKTFLGHTGYVSCLNFSHNGQFVASGTDNGEVIVWNMKSGSKHLQLPLHKHSINSLIFGLSNRSLFTCDGKSVQKWDIETGELLNTWNRKFSVISLDPKQKLMAGGSRPQVINNRVMAFQVEVLELENSNSIVTIPGHRAPISTIKFSHDGKRLFTASSGARREWSSFGGGKTYRQSDKVNSMLPLSSEIAIWDSGNGDQIGRFQHHSSDVNSIDISPDGTLLASGSDDYTAVVSNIETGDVIKVIRAPKSIGDVRFLPSGNQLLVNFRILDATNRDVIHGERIPSRNIRVDSQYVIAHENSNVQIWNRSDGSEVAKFTVQQDDEANLRTWQFSSFAVSSELMIGVVGGTEFDAVDESRKETGEKVAGFVDIFQIPSGQLVHRIPGDEGDVSSVSLSQNGEILAVAWHEFDDDQPVKIYRTKSAELLGCLDHINAQKIALSKNGNRLLCLASNEVQLWDLDTMKMVWTQPALLDIGIHNDELVWAPDGGMFAACSRDQVNIYSAKTGILTRRMQDAKGAAHSITFSPDGTRLFCGSNDQTIKIWDPRTGDKVAELRGHSENVNSLAIDGTGTTLFSLGEDDTIRIWRATHREVFDKENAEKLFKYLKRALGTNYHSLHSIPDLLRQAKYLAQQHPSPEHSIVLGIAHFRQGNYLEAVTHLNSKNATDHEQCGYLAMAHHKLGNDHLALRFAEKMKEALKSIRLVYVNGESMPGIYADLPIVGEVNQVLNDFAE